MLRIYVTGDDNDQGFGYPLPWDLSFSECWRSLTLSLDFWYGVGAFLQLVFTGKYTYYDLGGNYYYKVGRKRSNV